MLTPIQSVLSALLDQGVALVPVIVGLALLVAGGVMAIGNHQKGREGALFALIGGAIMLGSKTIAAAIHP